VGLAAGFDKDGEAIDGTLLDIIKRTLVELLFQGYLILDLGG